MNFLQFCLDYNIPMAPHGHKHHRSHWINIECPFCTGNPGYHLGFNIQTKSGFVCFRCGGHSTLQVVKELTRISHESAVDLIENYGGTPWAIFVPKRREWQISREVKVPVGSGSINIIGKRYLESRGFDSDRVIKDFGLMQTGLAGNMRHRIIIPVFYHGKMVSYTCRSVCDNPTRYLSCPAELEAIPIKDTLYHLDEVPNRNRIVVVEGCIDVWKLGSGAVATYGTIISATQIKILSNFDRVVLIRDKDQAGKESFRRLKKALRLSGVSTVLITLGSYKDVGELPQSEATYLMRSKI